MRVEGESRALLKQGGGGVRVGGESCVLLKQGAGGVRIGDEIRAPLKVNFVETVSHCFKNTNLLLYKQIHYFTNKFAIFQTNSPLTLTLPPLLCKEAHNLYNCTVVEIRKSVM